MPIMNSLRSKLTKITEGLVPEYENWVKYEFDNVFDALEGEKIDLDKWEVVDEQDYVEDYDEWADCLIEPNEAHKFADEIKAKPDGFSYLDKSYYKIRFKYFKKSKRNNN